MELWKVKIFLALEIARSKAAILLSQRKYILELLEDIGFVASKPAATPFDPSTELASTKGTPLTDLFAYRKFIERYYI